METLSAVMSGWARWPPSRPTTSVAKALIALSSLRHSLPTRRSKGSTYRHPRNKKAPVEPMVLPGLFKNVREGGFEPPRPFGHWHLKPARLPFRHSRVFRYPPCLSFDSQWNSEIKHIGHRANSPKRGSIRLAEHCKTPHERGEFPLNHAEVVLCKKVLTTSCLGRKFATSRPTDREIPRLRQ